MTRLYIVEQSGWEPGGHYHAYTGCVADGARELGLDPVILANKRARNAFQGPLPPDIVPCFTYTWGEAEQHGSLGWEPGNIAFEMFEGFEQVPPAADDHVFLHTLGYRELQALLACLTEKVPLLPLPNFHILLRRDPDILIDNYKHFADYFERLATSPYLQQKIRLYTDTHLLSEAFAQVCRVPFLTAPIPFDQSLLRQSLAARVPPAAGDPLTIVYLGDAREEKGYQHLPPAFSFLWKDYIATGRVRFILQSNFNTPGGEPGMLAASQILSGFPSTVIKSEPLKAAEYYDILAQSDLVVIPYSAQRYRYRSSGVLVEAMGAGKPIVTSAGSWMATQVTPEHAVLFETPSDLGPAIAAAIDRHPTLAAGAQQRQEAALKQATGASLVRHLLAAAEPAGRVARKPRRRILLVMNGDAMVLQNGASRVAHAQLTYLTAAGYDVVGLFLTYRGPPNASALEAWSTALGQSIAAFPLERVFVAGPGRWGFDSDQSPERRDRRTELGAPLKAEFDFVASFEFGGPLLQFLRDHPVDLVLLNYITNYPVLAALGLQGVPVVCEMHDLQAFQRAIYGQRPVDPQDLDEEFKWLAQCAALLSLNPRETAIVRERLPGSLAETTGVFLPPPKPPLPALAGAKDLAEIVSSSGPTLREYRFETAWEIGNTASVERLIEAGSVDLLYVSSDHKSNVSGLKWFFSEVYEPYLARHFVSMIVAGSICRQPGWPRDRRIFMIDQVQDLAPLYAAARVVVLPITEGAGSPVKTYEALAFGRPIVGTMTAFRGIDDCSEFIIRDDAEEFAEAILDLIASPADRQLAASRSRQAAAHYDFAEYFRVMDGVCGSVLNDTSKTTPPPRLEQAGDSYLEWTPTLQAMNRVVRSYLDGEPLEGWALDLLAKETPEKVDVLLRGVCDSLLDRRDASVLRTERRLQHYLARELGSSLQDDTLFAVRLAVAERAGIVPTKAQPGGLSRVMVHGGLPLTLAGTLRDAAERIEGRRRRQQLAVDGRPVALKRVADSRGFALSAAMFEAEVAPPKGDGIGMRLVGLDSALPADDRSSVDIAVLRQTVPISPGYRLLERYVIQGEFTIHSGSADLPPGQSGRLSLPRMSDGRHTAYVDLCFTATDTAGAPAARRIVPALSVMVDTEPQDVELIAAGTLTAARVLLGESRSIGDFGIASLEITNNGGHVLRLTAIHSGLLVGPLPAAIGIANALILPSQRRLDPAGFSRLAASAGQAVAQIISGSTLDAAMLATLCELAAEGSDESRLTALVEQQLARQSHRQAATAGIPRSVEAVIDDIRAIVGSCLGILEPGTAILAPALPFDIVDRNGNALPEATAAAMSKRRGSWRAALPDEMARGTLRVHIDADFDEAEHPGLVEYLNFYPVEGPRPGFRWTGPERTSRITIPLAFNTPTRLVIELGVLGGNTATSDFTITSNGSAVPHSLVSSRGNSRLTADLPPSCFAGPSTEIAMTVKQCRRHPPDERYLGVVFNSLSLLLDMSVGASSATADEMMEAAAAVPNGSAERPAGGRMAAAPPASHAAAAVPTPAAADQIRYSSAGRSRRSAAPPAEAQASKERNEIGDAPEAPGHRGAAPPSPARSSGARRGSASATVSGANVK